MKATLFTIAAFVLIHSAKVLHGQETVALPYVLYGKAPTSAEALASAEDKRIAAKLLTERETETELAEHMLARSNNPRVKQLAARIIKDNAAACDLLRRWAGESEPVSKNDEPQHVSKTTEPAPQESEASNSLTLRNVNLLSEAQLDSAYLATQLSTSRRQFDVIKVFSSEATPGFRNQLENLKELSWTHSRMAAELIKLNASPSIAFLEK